MMIRIIAPIAVALFVSRASGANLELNVSPNPVALGHPVTFTAAVAYPPALRPPSGVVTF